MKLAEIVKQPDGFVPPDITVRIDKVHDRKSGEGEYGEWSFQNVDISENGTKSQLKLKNVREFPREHEGRQVRIASNHSDKHGLTGLRVETREYKGKDYQNIVITESAKWAWDANGHSAPVDAPQSLPAAEKAAQPVQQAVQRPTGETEAYAEHLLQCAALAERVVARLVIGEAAAVQACFATVVIDAKNRNLLLAAEQGKDTGGQPEAQVDDDDIPF